MAGNNYQRREQQGAKPPPPVVTDLVPTGTYDDAGKLREALKAIQAQCHLTSPINFGTIPRGYGVTLAPTFVDPATDTYKPVGGKKKGGGDDDEGGGDISGNLALKGTALNRIAGARGVTWTPEKSGRVDDGADPHYARYRAVGKVRDPDGQWREEVREKEVDLRLDSATVRAMQRKQRSKEDYFARQDNRRPDYTKADEAFMTELDQCRTHIAALAESKAKNRVIRVLCEIRTTYTADDLARPFVACKLVFTGKFGDPEQDRQAATMITARELGYDAQGAAALLYGPGQGRALLGAPQGSVIDVPQSPAPPVDPHRMPDDSINNLADALDAEADESVPPPTGTRTTGAGAGSPHPAPAPEGQGEQLPLGATARQAIRYEDQDEKTQIDALLHLAELKGKIGDKEGQTPEAKFRQLGAPSRKKWYDALMKLPDVEDDTPAWAK